MTRRPQPRVEQSVRFVREQDGPPERELKAALLPLLREHCVVSAYLVVAEYGAPTRQGVCLAIRIRPQHTLENLAPSIASVFARMFGAGQPLDIMALSQAQEAHAKAICTPFFTSAL